jgi:hypothetical protein
MERKIVQLAVAMDNDGNETILALADDGTAWDLTHVKRSVSSVGNQSAKTEWVREWAQLPALPANHGNLGRVR